MAAYDGSIRIKADLDGSGIKKQLSELKASFATMRDVMQGPVAAVNMLTDAFGGLYKMTVGNASAMEDMEAAFTPLVGGADEAKKMIAALNKEAATTPYELKDIGAVAKQLLPVLGNDVEAVTKTFRMLGDTAGGNAQKLESITRGYTKAMLKGKVDMESLNMIAEAGVPIYKELADSMGVSVAQMMDMSSQGEITSADLTKAFEKMTSSGGIFFEGMLVSSKTLSGLMSTMHDTFVQLGSAIGQKILPYAKQFAIFLTDIAASITKWITEGDNLENVLSSIGYALSAVVAGLIAFKVASMASIVASGGLTKAIKTLTLAMSANQIGAIVAAITAVLIPALIWLWNNIDFVIQKIKEYKKQFMLGAGIAAVIMPVITAFAALAVGVIYAVKHWDDFVDAIKIGSLKAKIYVLELTTAIVDGFFNAMLKVVRMGAMIPGIGDKFKGVADKLNAYRKTFNDSTAGSINQSKKRISAIEAEAAARNKALEKEKKALEDKKKIDEEMAASAVSSNEDILAIQQEYHEKSININNALRDGIMSEDEAREAQIELAQQMVEAYNSMGYSAADYYNGSSRAGDKAAADMQKELSMLKLSAPLAFAVGLGLPEELATGIQEGTHYATTAIKEVVHNIYDAFMTAVSIFEGAFNILSWISDFSTVDMLGNLQSFLDGITNFFMTDIGAMPVIIKSGAEMIEKFLDGMISNLPSILETIGNVIDYAVEALLTRGKDIINSVMIIVQKILLAVLKKAPEIFDAILKTFITLLSGLIKIVPALIDGVFTAISQMIIYLAQNSGEIVSKLVIIALKIVEGVISNLPMILTSLVEATPYIVQALLGDLPAAIIKELPSMIEEIVPAFIATIPLITAQLPVAIAQSLGIAFVNASLLLPAELVKSSPLIAKAIIMSFVRIPGQLYRAFADIAIDAWKGFVYGLTTAGDIWSKVSKVFYNFVNSIKSFFGIHSPSKLFFSFGIDIAQGLINGIMSLASSFYDAIVSMASAGLSYATSLGKLFGDAILTGFQGVSSTLQNLITSIFTGAGADFAQMIANKVLEVITNMFSSIKSALDQIAHILNKLKIGGGGSKLNPKNWFASGTEDAPGGLAVVGERGAELVELPAHSRVYTASETKDMLSGRGAASILNGVSGSVSSANVSAPVSAGAGMSTFTINNNMSGNIVIDGKVLAKIVFNNIDRNIRAAYGY